MMNLNLLSKAAMFVGGALVGSAVTYVLIRRKFDKKLEERVEEEVQSVREAYAMSLDEERHTEEEAAREEKKEEPKKEVRAEVKEYYNKLKRAGYIREDYEPDAEDEEEYDMSDPYVISPDNVGDLDYAVITLDYYEGDKTLVNNRGKIIRNAEELVGSDFAKYFGRYEDDAVYIRNDKQHIDYEILRDYSSYTESY